MISVGALVIWDGTGHIWIRNDTAYHGMYHLDSGKTKTGGRTGVGGPPFLLFHEEHLVSGDDLHCFVAFALPSPPSF